MLLKNKKILVAVTGSIAIYKSLELIRLYIKAGAIVKVIMTDSATKFITPLTFEAISQNKVLCENTENWDKSSIYNHIDIGKWADVFVIAPISANTINKLANGIADNLLTQTVLAYPRTKIISPAANTNMLENKITQLSLEKLKLADFKIVSSQVKELACKDVGDGAMADPEDIFYATARELLKEEYWIDRKVILSGGGTIEKIDDIRYVSNFSSGKMASSLALSLYLKGANVSLASSRGYDNLPKELHVVPINSSKDMYASLDLLLQDAKKTSTKKSFFFMVAAVSDYVPTVVQKGKLKKDSIGSSWNLELNQNIDILSSLNKEGVISIGFKAEMDNAVALSNAKNMLVNKNLDAVCLNILDEKNYFGSEQNSIELILKENSHKFSGDKLEVSIDILNTLKDEFAENE